MPSFKVESDRLGDNRSERPFDVNYHEITFTTTIVQLKKNTKGINPNLLETQITMYKNKQIKLIYILLIQVQPIEGSYFCEFVRCKFHGFKNVPLYFIIE